MSETPDAPKADDPVLHFRRIAADIWARACGFFGQPDEIARCGFASRRTYGIMRDWIGALEKLVRRIVFFAALALDPPVLANAAKSTRAKAATSALPRARRGFRFFNRPRKAHRSTRRRSRANNAEHPVRIGALGRRLEALRHVLRHTDAHARRLSVVLARLARDSKPLPVLHQWLVHSTRMTSGEFEINDSMIAIEPPIQALLDARIPPHEEPG